MKKLGRNQPCWCGSGKKYKHCHLNRESEDLVPHWEVSSELRKSFSRKTCLVPDKMKADCSGNIIKAHTIPRSTSLNRIARNGHVYGLRPSFEDLMKHRGAPPPRLVGVRQASTFTGFCGFHDNSIFSPLEDQPYSGASRQDFLLLYRTQARELYTKQASSDMDDVRRSMDKGRSQEEQQEIQALALLFNVGVSSGLRDLLHYKERLDDMLLQSDFSGVRSLRLRLPEAPPVMVSGGFFPEQDFAGRELQDLSALDRIPDVIAVNSFFDGDSGYVVLSWLEEGNSTCELFIDSFLALPQDRQTDALIRCMFEHFENLFASPDWWEGLSEEVRKRLIRRMWDSANPAAKRPKFILAEDNLEIDHWNLSVAS